MIGRSISDEYSEISNLDLDNIKSIFIENNKMMQKFQCEYQRAQCVALSNTAFSCREVSKVTGISKSPVQRAIKRFEEAGNFHDRRRSDGPKKLND